VGLKTPCVCVVVPPPVVVGRIKKKGREVTVKPLVGCGRLQKLVVVLSCKFVPQSKVKER